MTPPQNRLKILLTPHHPTCKNFCLKGVDYKYATRVKSYNPLLRMVILLYGIYIKWALMEAMGRWMAWR